MVALKVCTRTESAVREKHTSPDVSGPHGDCGGMGVVVVGTAKVRKDVYQHSLGVTRETHTFPDSNGPHGDHALPSYVTTFNHRRHVTAMRRPRGRLKTSEADERQRPSTEKEMKTKQTERQHLRSKKRLQRLREHPDKCLTKHMEYIHSQTQESSSDSADTFILESPRADTGDDPDVPPLRRAESVLLTKENLKHISRTSVGSEADIICVESSNDECIPVKDSADEGSAEAPSPIKVPLPKQSKFKRTYRRKIKPRPSVDDEKKGTESEGSDDTGQDNVSAVKLKKNSNGSRVSRKTHYCLYCPVHCQNMSRHLILKHSSEADVAKALSFPLTSEERKLHFYLIRTKGNHAHSNEVLKWNIPQHLPFTEDVKFMHRHFEKCREAYQEHLKTNPNKKTWTRLANVTLAEVMLFNCRRAGQVSKMPLHAFTLRDTSRVRSDVALGLSKFEQKLRRHFQRIEIRGNRNRKVPILLTLDMLSSMEVLVAHRRTCGVPDDNPYFFARSEALTHLRRSDAIRQMAKECGVKLPATLFSTRRRKQVSTLSTVLEAVDSDLSKMEMSFCSSAGSSSSKKSCQPESDSHDHLTGGLEDYDGPGSVELATKGSSGSKKRRQPESDSDDHQAGSSGTKKQPPESDDDPQIGSLVYDDLSPDETADDWRKKEASKRRRWTKKEVYAVEKTLKSFIDCGKVPRKSDCVACIKASPDNLKNRSWTAVKFYVKNRITAVRRESAKSFFEIDCT